MKRKLLLLFAACFISILSVFADNYRTVYFENTSNWKNVSIHAWDNGNLFGDWPGGLFIDSNGNVVSNIKKSDNSTETGSTCEVVTIDNRKFYKITVNVGSNDANTKIGLIFSHTENNNTEKAGGNVDFELKDNYIFNNSGSTSYKVENGSIVKVEEGTQEDDLSNIMDFYLIGNNYGDNNWTPSSGVLFNKDKNYNYWLNVDNFSGQFKITNGKAWNDSENINFGYKTTDGEENKDGKVVVSVGSYEAYYNTPNFAVNSNIPNKVKLSFKWNPDDQKASITLKIEDLTGSWTGGEGGDDDDTGNTSSCSDASGKLPILHLNIYNDEEHTTFNNDMTNKDYLLKDEHTFATYYLEVPTSCTFDWAQNKAIGSEEEQLPLSIKLRGNYTRSGLSKKPYKLKLKDKQGLLGLSKSKHFALLAHADDDKGFMRNFIGFELGKLMELPWTPSQQPVEVVINGQYWGLYFLTESIRIEKDRVNIKELADGETDNTLASGGYLVELDNYAEDSSIQFSIDEKGCVSNQIYDKLRVTFDTPEVYSPLQRHFIETQFTKMNNLVAKANSSDEIWKYIDIDDLARYYIVEEILSHWESFHGSTYMFRDRGNGQKWHFSPLWDCGNAFGSDAGKWNYFYNIDNFGNTWIPSLRENNTFNNKVKETWKWFMSKKYDQLSGKIDAYASYIKEAAKADKRRWDGTANPNQVTDPVSGHPTTPGPVKTNGDILERAQWCKNYMDAKIKWLKDNSRFGDYTNGTFNEPARDNTPAADLPDYVSTSHDGHRNYVYVYDDKNWANNGDLYAYIYYKDPELDNEEVKNAAWSGVAMTYNKDIIYTDANNQKYKGVYVYEIPSWLEYGKLIVNGSKGRYPADGAGGMELNGKSVFFKTSSTSLTESTGKLSYPWSGTLPILRINTENGAAIPADKTKIAGTWTLQNTDGSYVTANGNNNLEIKGRGSDTWTNFDKKPYKIEFNKKQTILNQKESKHFALMPYLAGENDNVIFYNIAGYQLSRLVGLDWTPTEVPVELIINDEYQGLYYFTENIRPAGERVYVGDYSDINDATASPAYNMENDWLIEIDNFAETADYTFTSDSDVANAKSYKVVSSSPEFTDKKVVKNGHVETLSNYLKSHVDKLNKAANDAANDPVSWDWKKTFDEDQAAAYFLVQELMDDARAFETSCFLHHTEADRVRESDGFTTNNLWKFGPVWDFSGAFNHGNSKTSRTLLHDNTSSLQSAFVSKLHANKFFQYAVYWKFVKLTGIKGELSPQIAAVMRANSEDTEDTDVEEPTTYPMDTIYDYLDKQLATVKPALASDAAKWSQYAIANPDEHVETIKSNLRNNVAALADVYNPDLFTGIYGLTNDDSNIDSNVFYYDVLGRRVATPQKGQLYIVRKGANAVKVIY